jgi:hypothetical protein
MKRQMKNPRTIFEYSPHKSEADRLPTDRLRQSGFELREIDVPEAIRTLDSFLEAEYVEQRETFDYLKKTLNQTRGDQDERLLFSNE